MLMRGQDRALRVRKDLGRATRVLAAAGLAPASVHAAQQQDAVPAAFCVNRMKCAGPLITAPSTEGWASVNVSHSAGAAPAKAAMA